jgi:hypothetical protein
MSNEALFGIVVAVVSLFVFWLGVFLGHVETRRSFGPILEKLWKGIAARDELIEKQKELIESLEKARQKLENRIWKGFE